MKQLFCKEWREHFKLSLSGMAIFTLILAAVVRIGLSPLRMLAANHSFTISADGFQPLLSSEVQLAGAFFCGTFGLMLGWLQIQGEKHADLRAFLIHRPMERRTILAGKLLAGLALYAVGAGLPLAGLVVYVLIPGGAPAPFEWVMVFPVTAAFLLGLVYYAAGLLTGLRQARWFGSRTFGMGMAVVGTVGAIAFPEFWEALLALAAAGGILGVAVWSGFQTGGYYQGLGRVGKLALSVVSASAGLVLCGLLGMVIDNLLAPPRSLEYTEYAMTRDGRIYKVTQGGLQTPRIVDLDGHPLIDPKTGKPMDLKGFSQMRAPGLLAPVGFDHPHQGPYGRWLWYWESNRFFVPWQLAGRSLWYLTREGALVGFNGTTLRMIGTLEPGDGGFLWSDDYFYNNSFTSDQKRAVLATRQTVYRVDLDNRTLQTFATLPPGDAIGGMQQYDYNPGSETLVVTRNTIRLLSEDGSTNLIVPYQPNWPDYSTVLVHWFKDTNLFAVEFFPNWRLDAKRKEELLTEVAWVKRPREIIRRQTLPADPPNNEEDFIGDSVGLVFPPAVRLGPEFFSADGNYVYNKWDALSVIPAVLSALVGWGMGRRYHFTRREQAAWAAFHLIFGLPGLIAFFGVQEWPAKEPCPQCGKKRMVDREHCEYCGAVFAPPEPNGTEIFEDAVAAKDTVAAGGRGQGGFSSPAAAR